MLLRSSTDPRWLSHSWLLASGGSAVIIDAGAPQEPLLRAASEAGARIERVILTHHHVDHVAHRDVHAPVPVHAHPLDAEHLEGDFADAQDGMRLPLGDMEVTLLHVPGHTRGQINVLVTPPEDAPLLFTGDTLFRGSVGGTRAPGHGTFAQLRSSLLDVLLALPPQARVLPGHGQDTTIGREREENPFVRAWTGRDAVLDEPCRVAGRDATLLTWAVDYDGGFKAWLRWPDGTEDVVPGSRVDRTSL